MPPQENVSPQTGVSVHPALIDFPEVFALPRCPGRSWC
jgi:hypothetical protein